MIDKNVSQTHLFNIKLNAFDVFLFFFHFVSSNICILWSWDKNYSSRARITFISWKSFCFSSIYALPKYDSRMRAISHCKRIVSVPLRVFALFQHLDFNLSDWEIHRTVLIQRMIFLCEEIFHFVRKKKNVNVRVESFFSNEFIERGRK